MNDKSKMPKKNNSTTEAEETAQLATALSSPDPSLATVRDILFGAEIRESEKQRNDLEQQLRKLIAQVQDEAKQGRAALAEDMKQMRQSLDKEAAASTAEFNQQIAEVHETIKSLDNATSSAEADLAEQIQSNVNNLNTQMENWRDELSSQLEAVRKQLSNDKTDRHTLANLFAQMSNELMQDDTRQK